MLNSDSHPGRVRVRLTARTSTPRQRPVTSSYLREPTPEAFRASRSVQERNRAWLDGGYRYEPPRRSRNAEAERRAVRKLQPEKYALYCERERARKARARKEEDEEQESEEEDQ